MSLSCSLFHSLFIPAVHVSQLSVFHSCLSWMFVSYSCLFQLFMLQLVMMHSRFLTCSCFISCFYQLLLFPSCFFSFFDNVVSHAQFNLLFLLAVHFFSCASLLFMFSADVYHSCSYCDCCISQLPMLQLLCIPAAHVSIAVYHSCSCCNCCLSQLLMLQFLCISAAHFFKPVCNNC